MRFRRSPACLALAAVAACVLAPADALAFEDEWRVGGRAGVADLSGVGLGPALGLHAGYALSDMFDVTFEGLVSRHDGADGTDVAIATVGLAYKVDVFQWIPYVAVLGGYAHYAGVPGPGGEHGSEPAVAGQLGLDYLVTRSFGMGAELRWHSSLRDGLSFPLFSATLGAMYRFGP
jgi:hypothetical protein